MRGSHANGYPTKRDKAFKNVEVPVHGSEATITFEAVPAHRNDATGLIGPPDFEDAAFDVGEESIELVIIMRY